MTNGVAIRYYIAPLQGLPWMLAISREWTDQAHPESRISRSIIFNSSSGLEALKGRHIPASRNAGCDAGKSKMSPEGA